MDVFMEHLVQKKKDSKDKAIIVLLIFGGVALSLLLIMLMMSISLAAAANENLRPYTSFTFSIGLLLVALVWYGVYKLVNMRSVEYEYIVTNADLDIDKVFSKRGRKHLLSVNMREVQLMARIDDDAHNGIYKNPPQGVKVLNYSAMSNNGYTYFIDCVIDSTRMIVLFQPTTRMVESLWKYNPKSIIK